MFGDLLVEDYKIGKDLKKRLYDRGRSAIEIERKNDEIKIMIQCARPAWLSAAAARTSSSKKLTKKYGKKVRCSIIEIKSRTPTLPVAENIAAQLGIQFPPCSKRSMR